MEVKWKLEHPSILYLKEVLQWTSFLLDNSLFFSSILADLYCLNCYSCRLTLTFFGLIIHYGDKAYDD